MLMNCQDEFIKFSAQDWQSNSLPYSNAVRPNRDMATSNFLFQNEMSIFKPKRIPIKIILNDDEEVTSSNESLHTETDSAKMILNRKVSKTPVTYIFNILKSRKKEKKYLRKKFNKVISRVHNTDCLLKKIKA